MGGSAQTGQRCLGIKSVPFIPVHLDDYEMHHLFILIFLFFLLGMEEGYLSHDRILKLSVRFRVSNGHSSINFTKYIIFQCMCGEKQIIPETQS